MIPANVTMPLRVKTSLCANGETIELRLLFGDLVIRDMVFVNPNDTTLDEAITRLLRS